MQSRKRGSELQELVDNGEELELDLPYAQRGKVKRVLKIYVRSTGDERRMKRI